MKKAIQFGAGNIGRGVIGPLLSKSNYQVVFADINNEIINKLNENNQYLIHVKDIECTEEQVNNISGVMLTSDKIINEIVDAEIITAAIESRYIPQVALIIAKGIKIRNKNGSKLNLNIISCENIIESSTKLKDEIKKHLNRDEINYLDEYIGFPNCLVDRIVMPNINENDFYTQVEKYCQWIIDRNGFKGDISSIESANFVDDLNAYIERSIFIINTVYAMISYFGKLRGYTSIEESVNDKFIYDLVKDLVKESASKIAVKYKFDEKSNLGYIEKTIDRFKNPYLKGKEIRTGKNQLKRLNEYAKMTNNFNSFTSNLEIFNMLNDDMRRSY